MATFEELIAEGESVPVEGWDFSWFEGRATEERPSWGYSRRWSDRLGAASASLDIETGGGENYSRAIEAADHRPAVIAATESWPPNLAIARANLARLGGTVEQVADTAPLPFPDGSFDLVTTRHPTVTPWPEIARVLLPGGTFLSQQIGRGTNRELFEFMMGPQPVDPEPTTERLLKAAEAAGLEVLDLRQESPRLEFFDVAAIVVFLRKVIWTVPDFSVEKYRDRLQELHEYILENGSFESFGRRALVEARKPE